MVVATLAGIVEEVVPDVVEVVAEAEVDAAEEEDRTRKPQQQKN